MKTTPNEDKIRARMQPGIITYSGFLGDDKRTINQIISDDERALAKLGYTAEDVADRLDYFQQKSYDSYQGRTKIEDTYEVETEVVRGHLPCPFKHQGVYRKSYTTVTNLKNGKSVTYSSLNIHMIKVHHFFEGKGSHYRLDPQELVKVIFEK